MEQSKMHFRITHYTICYLLLSFVYAAVRVRLSNNNRNLNCGQLSSGTVIVPPFPQKISKVQVRTMELFSISSASHSVSLACFRKETRFPEYLRDDFFHTFRLLSFTHTKRSASSRRFIKMDRRSKYVSYRYSTYMQEGLALLKAGSSVEAARFTNDEIIGGNNNIPAKSELAPKNSAASKFHDANSTTERKKPYEDKGIRTTRNFIGKSCYNVGRSSKSLECHFLSFSFFFLRLFSFWIRMYIVTWRTKPIFAVRGEGVRLQSTRGDPRLQHAETRMPVDGEALRGSRIPGQRLVALLLPQTGQIHRMEATDGQKSRVLLALIREWFTNRGGWLSDDL